MEVKPSITTTNIELSSSLADDIQLQMITDWLKQALFCVYSRPKYSKLGQVPDTDIYRPLEDYDEVWHITFMIWYNLKPGVRASTGLEMNRTMEGEQNL